MKAKTPHNDIHGQDFCGPDPVKKVVHEVEATSMAACDLSPGDFSLLAQLGEVSYVLLNEFGDVGSHRGRPPCVAEKRHESFQSLERAVAKVLCDFIFRAQTYTCPRQN